MATLLLTGAFVLGATWGRLAWADDGTTVLGMDLTTLTAIGTAVGTVLTGIAGAAWRFWPRRDPGPANTPPVESVTLPPAVTLPTVPAPVERIPSKSVLIRQIKGDEALARFGELLPKLERVDWDALDDLGTRLERDREHLERVIGDRITAALAKRDPPAD